MATEQERLKALIDAGVATDDDKRRYEELLAGVAGAPASAPVSTTASPLATGDVVDFADIVDEEAFARGGAQYYMPSQEGLFKSKLVEVMKPSFTEKDQRWFIFETDDPKLKAQGRGAIVAEMGKGAFKLKDVLDGLKIPFTVVGGTVRYSIKLPLSCYADWSRDTKGLGEVRVSGLRTAEAGATIEKAI